MRSVLLDLNQVIIELLLLLLLSIDVVQRLLAMILIGLLLKGLSVMLVLHVPVVAIVWVSATRLREGVWLGPWLVVMG